MPNRPVGWAPAGVGGETVADDHRADRVADQDVQGVGAATWATRKAVAFGVTAA